MQNLKQVAFRFFGTGFATCLEQSRTSLLRNVAVEQFIPSIPPPLNVEPHLR